MMDININLLGVIMSLHILQRFNKKENKHWNRPERIKYFSGKTNERLDKRVQIGAKLFALGSQTMKGHGFVAVYEIKGIEDRECKVEAAEVEPFNEPRNRQMKQWRIKVNFLEKFDPNKMSYQNHENIRKLEKRMRIGTITDDLSNEILDLLHEN